MHNDNFTKGKRGEFRGDFTRDSFDPLRHYSRVLMQQGRVQLDADKNESDSIHLHHLRTLAKDLIGPHAAPGSVDGEPGDGFKITANGTTFNITAGHYFVNGILCENDIADEENITFHTQPDLPLTKDELKNPLAEGAYLVYLDVWERHLSYVEDNYIREKALGNVDTATRAKIVWQVKVINLDDFSNLKNGVEVSSFKDNYTNFLNALTDIKEKRTGSGRLRARARRSSDDNKDPCLSSPESSYRGTENQLYRVEIHNNSVADGSPTFKWSRENGSAIFPVTQINGNIITLEHLGRDNHCGLKPNDWIEIVDDDYTLRNRADALLQIEEIDPENLQLTLKSTAESTVEANEVKHPYLRRWDQKNGDTNGVPVKEVNQEAVWILLEDGVEVQFPTADDLNNNYLYHTGDYWLIPARSTTGDVEWPGTQESPDALPPQGVEHHYAPLALITVGAVANSAATKVKVKPGRARLKTGVTVKADLRRVLKTIWE